MSWPKGEGSGKRNACWEADVKNIFSERLDNQQ